MMGGQLLQHAQAIEQATFDIDGILTDERLYSPEDDSEFKILNDQSIKILVASGVRAVTINDRHLEIQHLHQGREDELVLLEEVLAALGLDDTQTAYPGDDFPNFPAIVGLGVTIPNTDSSIRQHTHRATSARGTIEAAREPCELALHARGSLKAAQAAYT